MEVIKNNIHKYIKHNKPIDFHVKGLAKYCNNKTKEEFNEIKNYIKNFQKDSLDSEEEQRLYKLSYQIDAAEDILF